MKKLRQNLNYNGMLVDIISTMYIAAPRIALLLAEGGSKVGSCTAYIEGLERDEIAIRNYSENEGMLKWLLDHGVITEPHRTIKVNHVSFPIAYIKNSN